MHSDALLTSGELAAINAGTVAVFALLALPFARRRHLGALGALFVFAFADSFILAVPLLAGLRIGNWNWIGKLASIAFSLVVMRLYLSPGEVAWRLPRGRRALIWTVVGVVGAVVLAVPAVLLSPSGRAGPETFLFEATLPGLDEELAFRGIGMALLIRTFSAGPDDERAPLLALAVSSLWFSMVHVVNIDHGRLGVSWFRITDTLPFGLWFALVRLRSNSLLGGVLAHNCGNLVQEALANLGV